MAFKNGGFTIVMVVLAVAAQTCLGCARHGTTTTDPTLPPEVSYCDSRCGKCGSDITINLKVTNGLDPEMFVAPDLQVTAPHRELLHFLEEAGQTKRFNFTLQWFPVWGYYLTSINSLVAKNEDTTYFKFLDYDTMQPLDKGLTSYMPHDRQTILFNFTTWATPGSH